ncbi:MAG TPA: FecR domain-containing protein [Williamwhitmania sp.]|nr:FecR domain-containing protein [Williamwhitmania sp.]
MKAKKSMGFSKPNSDEKYLEMVSTALRRFSVPATRTKEEAWQMLLAKMEERASTPAIQHYRIGKFVAMAAAAIIGLFIVTWFFLNGDERKISTGFGEMATVYLPDSSVVILNSGTTIWYSPKDWNKERLVKLDGEAFFKVKHGQKFSVVAAKTVTRVLGTTFNVYARGSEVRVSCLTGKVQVTSKISGMTTLLLPGVKTKVNALGKFNTGATSIEKEAAWVEGKFYYQQEGVGRVFDEIERQFNVTIIYNGSRIRSYTGFFTNKNLTDALDLVCIPMQLRYERIDNKTVKIFSAN